MPAVLHRTQHLITHEKREFEVEYEPIDWIKPLVMELPDGRAVVGYLSHDQDCQNPLGEYDGWKVYSFNSNHTNREHPEVFLSKDGSRYQEFNAKQRRGLAFLLSYFEHGESMWMLKGSEEWDRCPDHQWDGTTTAGVMIWETKDPTDTPCTGKNLVAQRTKQAREVIAEYTEWCNGRCFGWVIGVFDAAGNRIGEEDACWGVVGDQNAQANLKEEVEAEVKRLVGDR